MSKNYEALRAKNIQDNKRILAELGLLNPFKPLPKVKKNKIVKKPVEEKKPEEKEKKYVVTDAKTKPEDVEGYGSVYSEGKSRSTRSSSRLRGKKIDWSEAMIDRAYEEAEEAEEEALEEAREKRRVLGNRPMVYGPIPGVEVGAWWATRMECNHDGIHRPTVAGIHAGPKGAYSIALSGGYEDDIDMGDCFTYTGEGGRDLKGTKANPKNLRTAPQSKDQTLSKGNMALKTSSETDFPIRVIRGYKSESPFAPEEGYRYDGLYKCEKAWYTTGLAGFGVWKFALRRIDDQAPPPWTIEGEDDATKVPEKSDSEKVETDCKKETVNTENEKTEIEEKNTKVDNDEQEEGEEMKTKKIKTEVKEETKEMKEEQADITPKEESNTMEDESKNMQGKDTETIEEDIIEIKEENNNNEGLQKTEELSKETTPMKEIQATKNEGKKRKRSRKSVEDEFDDDEGETKKKKPKTETKKEKKEKENASMSKGLMGWLIKTP